MNDQGAQKCPPRHLNGERSVACKNDSLKMGCSAMGRQFLDMAVHSPAHRGENLPIAGGIGRVTSPSTQANTALRRSDKSSRKVIQV